ncbi:MAG: serine hydrolase domain-containing protein, partial [Dermatophilaceae bacterium]
MNPTRRATLGLLTGAGLAAGVPRAAASPSSDETASRAGRTAVGPDLPAVERYVEERIGDLSRVPGCGVAITRDGEVVWARAYGHRNLRDPRPFTLRTTHNIASVTKTYMTTLILALVDRGMVDLDADVNRYLPYPLRHPSYPSVPLTLRMMLSHTTGMAEVGPDPGPYADGYRAGDLPARDGEWARRCLARSIDDRDY